MTTLTAARRSCRHSRNRSKRIMAALALAGAFVPAASAQDIGTLNPKPLPPLAHPDDPKTPAKELFDGRCTLTRRWA